MNIFAADAFERHYGACEFADIPDDTRARADALLAALRAVDAAAAAMIAAGEDDMIVAGGCPSDWFQGEDVANAKLADALHQWADDRAEDEAEYLRDEAAERRGEW